MVWENFEKTKAHPALSAGDLGRTPLIIAPIETCVKIAISKKSHW